LVANDYACDGAASRLPFLALKIWLGVVLRWVVSINITSFV
jgi:hypothetical protein